MINKLNSPSRASIHHYDWHYDVIAIHADSEIDVLKIAKMKIAKSKISNY